MVTSSRSGAVALLYGRSIRPHIASCTAALMNVFHYGETRNGDAI